MLEFHLNIPISFTLEATHFSFFVVYFCFASLCCAFNHLSKMDIFLLFVFAHFELFKKQKNKTTKKKTTLKGQGTQGTQFPISSAFISKNDSSWTTLQLS